MARTMMAAVRLAVTAPGRVNNAADLDDAVMVEADASPKLAAETLEAPAGSVVAAPSHVVPAEVITVVDKKKEHMTQPIKICMEEKDDPMVRVLQKALLKDQKMKELCTTPLLGTLHCRSACSRWKTTLPNGTDLTNRG